MLSELHFAQYVLRALDETTAAVTQRLAAGTPADWPAYRQSVGELRGLLRAREIITDRFSDDERQSFDLNARV